MVELAGGMKVRLLGFETKYYYITSLSLSTPATILPLHDRSGFPHGGIVACAYGESSCSYELVEAGGGLATFRHGDQIAIDKDGFVTRMSR